jgi:hypothetical protein
LNSLPGFATLKIPFRLASASSGRAEELLTEKLASNHLTNEPVWFILQGCRRIGNEFDFKPPDGLACELFENRN